MRHMERRIWVGSLAVALLAGFGGPAVLAQSGESIKIGVIQPLSGPVAASGNYVRMGAEIVRDWINGRGACLAGRSSSLIEDNKSDPKEAATAAEKLIVRDYGILLIATLFFMPRGIVPALADCWRPRPRTS